MDGGGYRKVEAFAAYVREQHLAPIKWLWVDTCCINKYSAAELSKAINSMFDWYHDAKLCLAYLADVETAEDRSSFEKSDWFKRGWKLQELLAPQVVLFVARQWQRAALEDMEHRSGDHVAAASVSAVSTILMLGKM